MYLTPGTFSRGLNLQSGSLPTGAIYSRSFTVAAGTWNVTFRVEPSTQPGTPQTCEVSGGTIQVSPPPTPTPVATPTPTPKPTAEAHAEADPEAHAKPTPRPRVGRHAEAHAEADAETPEGDPEADTEAGQGLDRRNAGARRECLADDRAADTDRRAPRRPPSPPLGALAGTNGGPGGGRRTARVASRRCSLALVAAAGGMFLLVGGRRRRRGNDEPHAQAGRDDAVGPTPPAAVPTVVAAAAAAPPVARRRRRGAPVEPDPAAVTASVEAVRTPLGDPAIEEDLEPVDEDAPLRRSRRASNKLSAGAAAAAATVARAFDGPPKKGVERAKVGYRQVRISSEPDAIRSPELGRLDRGDEVEILESYEGFLQVRTPDERHRLDPPPHDRQYVAVKRPAPGAAAL